MTFKSVKTLRNFLSQRKIVHAKLLFGLNEYKLVDNALYSRSILPDKSGWEKSLFDLNLLFTKNLVKGKYK